MHDLSFLDLQIDFNEPATVAAYDEVALWSAMFGLLLLDEVPLRDVRRALDVGCGTGFPLIELAERLGPAATVDGIDPWSAALGRVAEKVRVRGVRNVTVHDASAASMPFEDGAFDMVVSNLGVNNFDDRAAAIRECRRVTRAGGTIALTTNLQGHMQELYDLFAEVLRERGDSAALERLREHVNHRATIAGVRALLADGGFTVTRVVTREAKMRFADGTALLNHYFVKLGFLGGWKAVAGAAAAEVFPLLLERSNAHAQRHGELAVTIPMAYIEAS
jgi:ubiquinone/menaquinone biosynthesis C-methylase UbiE